MNQRVISDEINCVVFLAIWCLKLCEEAKKTVDKMAQIVGEKCEADGQNLFNVTVCSASPPGKYKRWPIWILLLMMGDCWWKTCSVKSFSNDTLEGVVHEVVHAWQILGHGFYRLSWLLVLPERLVDANGQSLQADLREEELEDKIKSVFKISTGLSICGDQGEYIVGENTIVGV